MGRQCYSVVRFSIFKRPTKIFSQIFVSPVHRSTSTPSMRAYKILGAVQHYDWGMIGSSSRVAQFYSKQTGTPIEENKPYAELWFGTHVGGPSKIILEDGSTELLSDHIKKNPTNVLGEKVAQQWNNNLPFLFKILSINKALSIQAHPNKALAEDLNKKFPDVYKDDNHKPEIACALSQMDALCEFRSCREIAGFLGTVPELRAVIGEELSVQFESTIQEKGEDKEVLSKAFTALMKADPKVVTEQLQLLTARLQDKTDKLSSTIKNIHDQFFGDVGVFCVFFLNLVTMTPGQGVFLAADEPHAYLKGDCVECMAASDNVVRAGLTPKFKDVDTLTKMLTFKTGHPPIYSDATEANVYVYSPPVNEFEITKFVMYEHTQRQLEEIPGPSIMLVLSGKGRLMVLDQDPIELQEGTAVFTYANTNCYLVAHDALTIYRASVNDSFY